MASDVEICNRALQKLGAKRITSLDEDSVNGRACNAAYDAIRLAELRKHRWSFAIERASLAADATTPSWGRSNSFQLPSDFVLLAERYPEENVNTNDRIIEGRKILTNESAPLEIRYIKNVTDAETMDPLFREALSCAIAVELCEALTQSATKKDMLKIDYRDSIREAKKANAIEKPAEESPEDTWVTARL